MQYKPTGVVEVLFLQSILVGMLGFLACGVLEHDSKE